MKIIAKFILIVGLAVFAALYANNVSGHVIIFLDRYRIDLLLTTMIIIIVLIYVLMYYVIRFWISIHKLPDRIRIWKSNRSSISGHKYLNNAEINYLEGRFALSFKNAMKAFVRNKEHDDKFLSLILAYKSANMVHDYKQEEDVFNKLIEYDDKKWNFTKLMVIAKNQYKVHDYKACLDNLNLVLQLDKKHISARVLMLKIHLKLNDFNTAHENLVWLIKHNYLDGIQVESYKIKVYRGLFENIQKLVELQQIYHKVDKYHRMDELVNQYYLAALIRIREFSTAVNVIKTHANLLFWGYDNIIVLAKKLEDYRDVRKLFEICEKCCEPDKRGADLLLVMGILAFTLKLLDIAQQYLQGSLILKPTTDGYLYLSCLVHKTNDSRLIEDLECSLNENIHNLS